MACSRFEAYFMIASPKASIRDGVAVAVEGVRQRITFILEGEGKGPGYVPENCLEMM